MDMEKWCKAYLAALEETFGERVWFAGIQGSRARGEATESSDIDTVAVFDELSAEDVRAYDKMLDALPNRELTCGFLSGKDELLNWEPSDLFQFYFDTRPLKGSLDDLIPLIDKQSVSRAVKLGLCNIYHGCVHNMLYEKSGEILVGLYKTACFVLRAVHFEKTGRYVSKLSDLCDAAGGEDGDIARAYAALKNGGWIDFNALSDKLLEWTQTRLKQQR